MLIFSDNFNSYFQVGTSYVTEHGYYAIAYTMETEPKEHGHLISVMSVYRKLMKEKYPHQKGKTRHQLCMFPCSSIRDPCIAVPWRTDESIVNANEWLVFHNQKNWYDIFIKEMRKENRKAEEKQRKEENKHRRKK